MYLADKYTFRRRIDVTHHSIQVRICVAKNRNGTSKMCKKSPKHQGRHSRESLARVTPVQCKKKLKKSDPSTYCNIFILSSCSLFGSHTSVYKLRRIKVVHSGEILHTAFMHPEFHSCHTLFPLNAGYSVSVRRTRLSLLNVLVLSTLWYRQGSRRPYRSRGYVYTPRNKRDRSTTCSLQI